MKKSIILLLTCVFIMSTGLCVRAAEPDTYSHYDAFKESAEYETIVSADTESVDYVKEILTQEAIPSPAGFDTLSYERIVKVYVDTEIEKTTTDEKSELMDLLQDSNYVWVVPLEVGSHNFQITFGKSSGEWKITEVAERTVMPYDRFLAEIQESYEFTDIVLIGGMPSFHMPVALAFDDTKAVAWIDLGYSEMNFEDLIGSKKAKSTEPVYDYEMIQQAMQEAEAGTTIAAGGAGANGIQTIFVSIGLVFGVLLVGFLISFFIKHRTIK